mmetsp:Transcript_60782/g.107911  ORF Transcript_60782/g.107911 Transcript_60782/m.107911 type:complete len:212 (+) Transcript_60782:849-1484(+)
MTSGAIVEIVPALSADLNSPLVAGKNSARPTSMSTASGGSMVQSMTFSSFKSLCMTPLAWQYATPSQTWRRTSQTQCSSKISPVTWARIVAANNVPPGRRSVIRWIAPGSTKNSKRRKTEGWSKALRRSISAAIRIRWLQRLSFCVSMTFMTRNARLCRHCTLRTTPKLPAPRMSSILKKCSGLPDLWVMKSSLLSSAGSSSSSFMRSKRR